MKKEVLIVLGSPNSPLGVLSAISKSRLDYCEKHHSEEKLVICTGGWGKHFNTSKQAHADYSKAYLIKKGLSEKHFLAPALSSNTVDDAVKILPILEKLENAKLTIITSDYHMERVSIIFKAILKKYEMTFIGTNTDLDKKTYESLVIHEKNAIESILKNGLYY